MSDSVDGFLSASASQVPKATVDGLDVSPVPAAYHHVLRRIRLGELVPGARVRTEEVAAEVGMSRTPVREAIRRLEAEGYITSRPNRGAMVSQHTPDELLELFEIRAVLEGLAMREAAKRVRATDLQQIESLLAALQQGSADPNTWLARHSELHIFLCSLSGRPLLVNEIARRQAALEPYLRLWFMHAGLPPDPGTDHACLLEALRSGYPAHAEEVMRDHILETAPSVIAHLEATGVARSPRGH